MVDDGPLKKAESEGAVWGWVAGICILLLFVFILIGGSMSFSIGQFHAAISATSK